MSKFGGREFVVLVLSLLIATPPRIAGAANGPATRAALGSIESRGAVRIGEVLTPSQNTLFAGDRVQTNNGGAVIQYQQGSRVVLSSETVANFAPARVQLEKGLMTFESASNSGMIFAASTLRLEPAAAKTAANVTISDSKASVAVTQGTLKVVDPSGLQLASLNAGEARMFEDARVEPEPASASSPSAPAAAPQGGGGRSHRWAVALGVAAVGVTLGAVGIVRANDANSRADSANASASTANAAAATAQTAAGQASAAAAAAAAQAAAANAAAAAATAQVTALTAQVTAANAAAAALQARVNGLSSQASVSAALSADLATQIARLSQIQTQLNTIVAQLAAGTITPAEAQRQIGILQGALTAVLAAINADQSLLVACSAPVVSGANPGCHT
jgi:hypothetical protein